MKKVFAILALAASLAACARLEQPVDGTPEGTPEGTETAPTTYTLTVRATKDAGTRVLELVTDGETHRQTLNAKWEPGDKVEVYDGETCLGELTAGAVAPDGMSCTFSGELEGLPDETSSLTLKYLSPAYEEQDGTLEYISENCDYAEAEVNVTVEGTTITCGDALFVSRQAVVKFLLKNKAGVAVSATSFIVKDEEATYTVTPEEAASELFVALPGIADRPLSLSATSGPDTYTYWKSGVTLNAGQYYSIAVKMDPTIDLGNEGIYNTDGIFTAQDGNVLTGTFLGDDRQVRIAGGATVTLRDVSIECYDEYDGIALDGSATLLLEGKNTVGGGSYHAGIYVPEGSTLVIDGGGSLEATGGYEAAGIGSRPAEEGATVSCGDITISGGTVTAYGGFLGGAGIGGGHNSSCGVITLSGGTVTATGGNRAAGIGGGLVNEGATVSFGDIIISGGSVTANGDSGAAGIGSGYAGYNTEVSCGDITISGGTVTATGGYEAADIGRGTAGEDASVSGGVITLSGGSLTAGGEGRAGVSDRLRIADNATVTLNGVNLPKGIELAGSATINLAGENTVSADEGDAGISVPSGSTLTLQGDGSFSEPVSISDNATVTLNGVNLPKGIALAGSATINLAGENTVSADEGNAGISVPSGSTLTLQGNGSFSEPVSISDNATVTLNGVNLPKGIALAGSATINLAGENTVSADEGNAGISVPEGSTLTIQGTGSLTATGGSDAAGIGGGYNSSCGAITISGGTVTATGGKSAAGIGSGYAYFSTVSCGAITISGGTVEANGGEYAAGIGSGYAYSSTVSCVAITISGGTVTATGGSDAAGIGSGSNGRCENITIDGGSSVTATGGKSAAGIGSGYNGSCGAIAIGNGSSVTATGGESAAGIGSGSNGRCENITIGGGSSVTATGGENAAGIGSGYNSSCGDITIYDSTVTATGGENAAGIGSGYNSSCGDITIFDPAQVKATKGNDAVFSIGPAAIIFPCGAVTINGQVWGEWDETMNSFMYYNINGKDLCESPLRINWPSE